MSDTIDRKAVYNALECMRFASENEKKYAFSLLEQIPTAEPKWIPCSERLPEEKAASYWACTDAGYQFECRWTNVNHLFTNLTMKWHWHVMDVPQYSMVVAWKPLPEPYKGEDTKNEL